MPRTVVKRARSRSRSRAAARSPAAQQVDLEQADRVDVGVAQADHAGEQRSRARAASRRPCSPSTRSQCGRTRCSTGGQIRLAGLPGEVGVAAGDVEVGLGQHHLDVAEQVGEERPLARHRGEQLLAVLVEPPLEPGADAEPARQQVAALRPGEDPGDRAQVGDAARRSAGTPAASRSASARSRRSGSPAGSRRGSRGRRAPARGTRAERRRPTVVIAAARPVGGGGELAAGRSPPAPRRPSAPGCARRSRAGRTWRGRSRPAR